MEIGLCKKVKQTTVLYLLCEAKEKTSKYKGVSYHRETGKWDVRVSVKGEKQKYGGRLDDELDAAKRVNEICKDFGIPPLNPEISAIPNQKYQVI